MTLEEIGRALTLLPEEQLQVLAARFSRALGEASWPPLTKLELLLTEDCNLRCDYCWIPKRPLTIPESTAAAALRLLFEQSRDHADLSITLFGGEPLLAWSRFKWVVRTAENMADSQRKCLHWAVTTNGVLLDEEKVDFGVEHGIAYLLSIDGGRVAHDRHRKDRHGNGSFDAVVAKLPLLKRAQGWLGARITVNPDTVQSLSAGVELLAHMGINQFLVGANPTAVWAREDRAALWDEWRALADLYATMRQQGWPIRVASFENSAGFGEDRRVPQWGCEAGRDKVAVSASGDIYPCSRFVDAQWLREASWLGHVSTGITADLVRRQLVDGRIIVRQKCMRCRNKLWCAGGCPATNWLTTGSPFAAPALDCEGVQASRRLRREKPEAYRASNHPFCTDPLAGGLQCGASASPFPREYN